METPSKFMWSVMVSVTQHRQGVQMYVGIQVNWMRFEIWLWARNLALEQDLSQSDWFLLKSGHTCEYSYSLHALNFLGIRRSLQTAWKWDTRETARNQWLTAFVEEQAHAFGMLSHVCIQILVHHVIIKTQIAVIYTFHYDNICVWAYSVERFCVSKSLFLDYYHYHSDAFKLDQTWEVHKSPQVANM